MPDAPSTASLQATASGAATTKVPVTPPTGAKPAASVLPADAPTLEEAQQCVQCVRSFGAVQRLRSVTRPKEVNIVLPDTAADSFTLGDLEAFFEAKRTTRAEFSQDLLCRMVSHASPNHIVDAASLRVAAAVGPYARDWRRVFNLAQAHTRRAHSARARRDEAQRTARPPASSPRQASAGPRPPPSSARSTTRRPTRPAASASEKGLSVATARHPGGGDEFRDGTGRKRLYLPTVEHPPWSQHAGGVYCDRFDDVRRNAAGQSVRQFLEERRAADVARSMHVTPNTSGIVDCGTTVVKGNRHKQVSRGALLLDMSRIEGRTFITRFAVQFEGNRCLPLADSQLGIGARVAPCLRQTAGPAVNRRIDESIARVVTYLDNAC